MTQTPPYEALKRQAIMIAAQRDAWQARAKSTEGMLRYIEERLERINRDDPAADIQHLRDQINDLLTDEQKL